MRKKAKRNSFIVTEEKTQKTIGLWKQEKEKISRNEKTEEEKL